MGVASFEAARAIVIASLPKTCRRSNSNAASTSASTASRRRFEPRHSFRK